MEMGLERFGLRTGRLVGHQRVSLLAGVEWQLRTMIRLEAVRVVRQTMNQFVVEFGFQTMKILQLVEYLCQTVLLLFEAVQTSCLAVVEMLRTKILFAVVVGLLQKENLLFGLFDRTVILAVALADRTMSLAGLVEKRRQTMNLVEQVGCRTVLLFVVVGADRTVIRLEVEFVQKGSLLVVAVGQILEWLMSLRTMILSVVGVVGLQTKNHLVERVVLQREKILFVVGAGLFQRVIRQVWGLQTMTNRAEWFELHQRVSLMLLAHQFARKMCWPVEWWACSTIHQCFVVVQTYFLVVVRWGLEFLRSEGNGP